MFVQFSELAQFPECAVTLRGRGKCDDAVWCPIVGSEGGRLRVLANEGQLSKVVVLWPCEYMVKLQGSVFLHLIVPAASR
jgi:hypothetical protein